MVGSPCRKNSERLSKPQEFFQMGGWWRLNLAVKAFWFRKNVDAEAIKSVLNYFMWNNVLREGTLYVKSTSTSKRNTTSVDSIGSSPFPISTSEQRNVQTAAIKWNGYFWPWLTGGELSWINSYFHEKTTLWNLSKRYLETISTFNEWALRAMTSKDVSMSLISSPNARTGLDLEISHFLIE